MSTDCLRNYIDPDEKSWSIFSRRSKARFLTNTIKRNKKNNNKHIFLSNFKDGIQIFHNITVPKRFYIENGKKTFITLLPIRILGNTLKDFIKNSQSHLYLDLPYDITIRELYQRSFGSSSKTFNNLRWYRQWKL